MPNLTPPITVWLTGLSASGKTSIATALDLQFKSKGVSSKLLDGDILRSSINKGLGFSVEDRAEAVRRVAEVARILNDSGVLAIVSMISPLNAMRKDAKKIVGVEKFFEIYVSTPLHICEQRDPKGLYRRAREENLDNFTGITSPYEPPLQAAIVIDTSIVEVDQAAKKIWEALLSNASL